MPSKRSLIVIPHENNENYLKTQINSHKGKIQKKFAIKENQKKFLNVLSISNID